MAGIKMRRAKSTEYSPDLIGLRNVSALGGWLSGGTLRCILEVTSTKVIESANFFGVFCGQHGRAIRTMAASTTIPGQARRARPTCALKSVAANLCTTRFEFSTELFTSPCL